LNTLEICGVPGFVVNSLKTPDALEAVGEVVDIFGRCCVVGIAGAFLKTPEDILNGGLKVVTSSIIF
jgi:hypothetical protein